MTWLRPTQRRSAFVRIFSLRQSGTLLFNCVRTLRCASAKSKNSKRKEYHAAAGYNYIKETTAYIVSEVAADTSMQRLKRGRVEEALGGAGGADLVPGEGDRALERLV